MFCVNNKILFLEDKQVDKTLVFYTHGQLEMYLTARMIKVRTFNIEKTCCFFSLYVCAN